MAMVNFEFTLPHETDKKIELQKYTDTSNGKYLKCIQKAISTIKMCDLLPLSKQEIKLSGFNKVTHALARNRRTSALVPPRSKTPPAPEESETNP